MIRAVQWVVINLTSQGETPLMCFLMDFIWLIALGHFLSTSSGDGVVRTLTVGLLDVTVKVKNSDGRRRVKYVRPLTAHDCQNTSLHNRFCHTSLITRGE